MRPPADVVVLGDALLDVSVAPSQPVRTDGDVPAAIRLRPGGQGANVAVRLARRGLHVRLACALADDPSGRILREALELDGVELDRARATETGAVVILVAPGGERTMLSRRVPLLPRTLDASPWTVVSGYVLLEDAALELRGRGRRAVLGCAMPHGGEGEWWRRARELQPDLVILNTEEAAALGADAAALARDSGALVAVTGQTKVAVAGPDPIAERHITVQRVSVRDTTGAGDAFAAAFLAELHDRAAWADADVDRALAAGVELSAAVAAVDGAQAGVPLERREALA